VPLTPRVCIIVILITINSVSTAKDQGCKRPVGRGPPGVWWLGFRGLGCRAVRRWRRQGEGREAQGEGERKDKPEAILS